MYTRALGLKLEERARQRCRMQHSRSRSRFSVISRYKDLACSHSETFRFHVDLGPSSSFCLAALDLFPPSHSNAVAAQRMPNFLRDAALVPACVASNLAVQNAIPAKEPILDLDAAVNLRAAG